jgi:hypothetical protein
MPRLTLRSCRLSFPLGVGLLLAAGAGAQTLPMADAGEDQSFPCAPVAGQAVTLDGSGSSDPDPLATLTYTWTGAALPVPVDGVAPVVTLPAGVHVLTLTVDDGVDGTDTDDVQVTIVADPVPPQLVLSPMSTELWPPNHKVHALSAADFVQSATDDCDVEVGPEDVHFVRGTSDEEDNGKGDGNTTGDLLFDAQCTSALVRSERAGPGDGRVYQLTLSLADAAGNAAEAVVDVAVPHDRAHDAVDTGDLVEVLADSCGPVELCPAEPDPACAVAPSAEVDVRTAGKKAGLRWRASGFAAADGAYADPATDYQLCIYTADTEGASLVDDPTAPRGMGWKRKDHSASFRAKKAGADTGLDSLKLVEKNGEGSLSLATSESAVLPDLPLAAGTSLVLQLRDSEGVCVGSTFDDPEDNTEERFSDEIGG